MAWGRGDEGRGDPISGCVPDCDRVGPGAISFGPFKVIQGGPFDCNHVRLHRGRRVGLWHEGKWIDHLQLGDVGDTRVGADWARTEGRDADIRRRYENGATQMQIGDLYRLDQGTISRIINGNHQRPRGKYGAGKHIKRPTQLELDRIAQDLCDLLDERGERPLPWDMHTCL
jgi:hypothetical protein